MSIPTIAISNEDIETHSYLLRYKTITTINYMIHKDTNYKVHSMLNYNNYLKFTTL